MPAEVIALLSELCALHRPPAVLLERDGDYPSEVALRSELDALALAANLPPITGEVTVQ